MGITKPIIKIHNYILVSKGKYNLTGGTGFIIERNKKRFMVTAYHVLDGVLLSEYFTYDHKPILMEFGKIYLIPHLDAAILELKYCSASFIPLKLGKYKQDGRIKTVGFPNGDKLSEYYGFNYRSMVETDAFVEYGMSGGPVLDDEGNVIGIISAKKFGDRNVKGQFSRLEDIFYRLDHK